MGLRASNFWLLVVRSAVTWLAFGSLAKRTQPLPRYVPITTKNLPARKPIQAPARGIYIMVSIPHAAFCLVGPYAIHFFKHPCEVRRVGKPALGRHLADL